jgi:hypothetical protein
MSEVLRTVALALAERRGAHGRPVLGLEHVHGRVREVRQPAGVIEIEVRGDDVTDVGGIEAELANLGDRCRLARDAGAHDMLEHAPETTADILEVVGTHAGIDEDQAVVRLDQPAVADHPRGREKPAFAVDQLGAEWT